MSEHLTITEPDELLEEIKILSAKVIAKSQRKAQHERFSSFVSYGTSIIAFTTVGQSPNKFLGGCLCGFILMADPFLRALYKVSREKRGDHGLSENEIETLFSIKDKRVIGTLLDFDKTSDAGKYSLQRKDALRELLPLLTSEETWLLNREQQKALVRLVQVNGEGLTFVVLEALSKIGDGTTRQALKRWKISPHIMPIDPDARNAVNDCIAAIEARLAASQSDSQLLRPAFSTGGADTYLRPVTHKPDENAETLLHAEIGEKRE